MNRNGVPHVLTANDELLPLFVQAGVVDVAAVDPIALSNAIEITPGS